jgi:hypothetical protein
MRPSKKDGDFNYWIGVRASYRNARLRKRHEMEEAMKLRDGWTCKAADKVRVWSQAMLNMDNAQPWTEVLLSQRQETLDDHPPWLTRYDSVKNIWHCLEHGSLQEPDYVKFDIEGLNCARDYRHYRKSTTPRFRDSDFEVLTGKPFIPSQPVIAEGAVEQAVVGSCGPVQPETSIHEFRHLVQAGQRTFPLPSIDDMIHRVGMTWRDMKELAIDVRKPAYLRWKEGLQLVNKSPQPGDATDFEVALQTLGLSTTHLPTRKKVNALAITDQQAAKMGLASVQAMEMVEFVERLSNAGHNHRHWLEQQKVHHQPRKATKKNNDAQPKSTSVGLIEPPFNRPVSESWVYAPEHPGNIWSWVEGHNPFEFTAGTCLRSDVAGAEREDAPVWLIDLPSRSRTWRLVVHRATFVCQILLKPRFKTLEEIVRYSLEYGVRISTVAPRHEDRGEHLKLEVELRRKELGQLKIGYLHPGEKLTIAEFDMFMRTCSFKFASDPTIGRIALKSGGIVWRLAMEHVYPEVVMDGPSRDALWLGICERLQYIEHRAVQELVDDELSRTIEQYLVGGYSNKVGGEDPHHESIRTIFPTNAAWGALGAVASWDARQEEQYQSIIRRYRTESKAMGAKKGDCELQPKNVKGWRDMMRGHHKYAAKMWDGAEEHAQRWLAAKDDKQPYLMRQSTEVGCDSIVRRLGQY